MTPLNAVPCGVRAYYSSVKMAGLGGHVESGTWRHNVINLRHAARRLWRAGINGLEEDAMGDQDDDDDGDEEDFWAHSLGVASWGRRRRLVYLIVN